MTLDATRFDQLARGLSVAVMLDMLEGLELRNQIMPPHLGPVEPSVAPDLAGAAPSS